MTQVSFHGIGRSSPPSIETCQPCIRSTLSGIQSVYSVRDLTGLYLRAERERSDANRVRGLVHKLRLAATPPHPDSFAALGIRPLPARGERSRKWLCLAPQLKCDSPALWGRGVPTSERCAHTRHAIPYPAWGPRRSPRSRKARAQAPPPPA